MARKARLIAVDCAHHVTQRGNNQQKVFFSDVNRRKYLSLLTEYSIRCRLDIVGYCLMPNHVHLVVIPRLRNSMARTLAFAHGHYAQYLNFSSRRSGHLWQSRYYSCPMDFHHLWNGLRYVELNPLRANLVNDPSEWSWSSASSHLSDDTFGTVPLRWDEWNRFFTAASWREFLMSGTDSDSALVRSSTRAGRPLGRPDLHRTATGS